MDTPSAKDDSARPPSSDSSKLWARHRDGDPEALPDLVASKTDQLRRYARSRLSRQVRSSADSGDIVSDTLEHFLRTLESGGLTKVRNKEHLLALLVTMVRNSISNVARDSQRLKRGGPGSAERRISLEQVEKELTATSESDPVAAAERHEERDQLDMALALLNPELGALLRRRLAGESIEDLARAEGSAAEAIRKRLQRAVARVRTLIEQLEARRLGDIRRDLKREELEGDSPPAS